MRLIADLHIAPRTVEYLKSLGHDVVRVSQVLPPTSPDHEIIAYAARDRRGILTQDLVSLLRLRFRDKPILLLFSCAFHLLALKL